jgi:hypothetical protein
MNVGAESRSALQEHQPRQLLSRVTDRDHFAGEDLDLLPGGIRVVNRHGENTVGKRGSLLPVRDHDRHPSEAGCRGAGLTTAQHCPGATLGSPAKLISQAAKESRWLD